MSSRPLQVGAWIIAFLWLGLRVSTVLAAPSEEPPYHSPYSVHWTVDPSLLTADFSQAPRSDTGAISVPPGPQWFEAGAYTKGQLSWGPRPGSYPAPRIPEGVDKTAWRQQRVLAVALKYQGLHYQHHHLPDWDPSKHDWAHWSEVSLGHNSAGIDCSNFTGWCYNFGLGIKLNTATEKQAELTQVDGPEGPITVQTLLQATDSGPVDYQELVKTLRTGDLLYIRGKADSPPGTHITHVVMWVGEVGVSPDHAPLIIDSHDNRPPVQDNLQAVIPAGVQLRPFVQGSWYHRAFDHAHRIILP